MAELPGSLVTLFEELVSLEETIHDDLRVYMFQPEGTPELPAVWNWIDASPADMLPDTGRSRGRDDVVIPIRLGVRHTEVGEFMPKLMFYADCLRDVVDKSFARRLGPDFAGPLNGACVEATRKGMEMKSWKLGGSVVLGMEFRIVCALERFLRD